jgi:hypothetical protein
MNVTHDMKEKMLEFSPADFEEAEASAAGHDSTLGGRTDSASRAGGSLDGALSGVGLQRGRWESWFRRGIPELDSPLAG